MSILFHKKSVFQGTFHEILNEISSVYDDVPIYIESKNNNQELKSLHNYIYYKNENLLEEPQYIYDIMIKNGDILLLKGPKPEDIINNGIFKKKEIVKIKFIDTDKTIIRII